MKLNFSNSAHIKMSLLAEGARVDDSFSSHYTDIYAPNLYKYSIDNKKIDLPRQFLLPDDVLCAINHDNESPWLITYSSKHKFHVQKKWEVYCSNKT